MHPITNIIHLTFPIISIIKCVFICNSSNTTCEINANVSNICTQVTDVKRIFTLYEFIFHNLVQ